MRAQGKVSSIGVTSEGVRNMDTSQNKGLEIVVVECICSTILMASGKGRLYNNFGQRSPRLDQR